MSTHPETLRFDGYDPHDERRRESLFSLGNGVLLLRSAMSWSQADSLHYPGTYFAGCYNSLPSTIEGQTVWNESIVNLPNGLFLQFRIEDREWFSLETTELLDYQQVLDLQCGLMQRTVRFRDPSGRVTTIGEERFVSMAAPNLVGQRFSLTPHNWSGTVLLKSSIDGSVINGNIAKHADHSKKHLKVLSVNPSAGGQFLEAQTINSKFKIAVRMREKTSTQARDVQTAADAERSVCTFVLDAKESRLLTVDKLMAVCVGNSDDVGGETLDVLSEAESYETSRSRHLAVWSRLWAAAPFTSADRKIGQSQHLTLFHLLQNFSHHSMGRDVSLPARGLQEVYRGQIFWDEMFSVPVLSLRFPLLARELLAYRHARLGAAKENARKYGLDGALYPWRSASTGAEETPRFQKSSINQHWREDHTEHQAHINGSIAWDIFHYVWSTGDQDFFGHQGLEMLVEICRMWASLATYDRDDDRFDIKGIVGPDEFHTHYRGRTEPGIDNNAYTNVMAVWTLMQVLDALALRPDARAQFGITAAEMRHWDHVSRRLRIAFLPSGLVGQFQGVEELEEIDIQSLGEESADWVLEDRGKDINHYQVFKQADFAMLLYLFSVEELQSIFQRLGYELSAQKLQQSVEYYHSRTSHGSSLSKVSYAAAFSGFDPSKSLTLWRKALAPDLDPTDGKSTAEGLHLGSMDAALDVLQRRYLGLTSHSDGLALQPTIPADLPPIEFTFFYRGKRQRLRWDGSEVQIRDG